MTSIRIPFNYSGGKTKSTNSVKTIAEQKIIDVLVTNKLERVMRPRYGSSIGRLLFEPMDELYIADVLTDAKQDVAGSVSRITILDMRVSEPDEISSYGNSDSTLGITVIYKLPLGSPQVVNFNIAIPSNMTEDSLI